MLDDSFLFSGGSNPLENNSQGMAGHGLARQGMARHGWAWQGMAGRGEAWLGVARHGVELFFPMRSAWFNSEKNAKTRRG